MYLSQFLQYLFK